MQRGSSDGSALALVRQSCTPQTKNQPTNGAGVGDRRAREGGTGGTGCGSRAALSEGSQRAFASAALQMRPHVLRPGPDRPNVPVWRYGCSEESQRASRLISSAASGFISVDFRCGGALEKLGLARRECGNRSRGSASEPGPV